MTASDTVLILDGSTALERRDIGGKAHSINEMRRLGLPVPPAFVIPTHLCAAYDPEQGVPDTIWSEVISAISILEQATGRRFGQGPSPLLVSVRSGAEQSMPGMMDTVLNLGLNPELVEALAVESGDPAWAQDTWRRFCESYADIVLDEPGELPPDDSATQLRHAIGAVFASWNSARAIAYRQRHQLTGLAGTAVTVQAMVFGNRDLDSGTGVMFSRDPSSGEDVVTGDWLARAQGEEVVSGTATPLSMRQLRETHPQLHHELERVAKLLESQNRDLMDIEFTVESGQVYILQSRAGKRSPHAAMRIAVDLVREGVISTTEALDRVSAEHLDQVSRHRSTSGEADIVARGSGIGTGVATGVAVTDPAEAQERTEQGEDIILVRTMTSPEDVPAMFASVAVVTEIGGTMSHAALVCREIGLPCVVGCGDGAVDALLGRTVTVDGTSGVIRSGTAAQEAADEDPRLAELLSYLEEPAHRDHRLQEFAPSGGDEGEAR